MLVEIEHMRENLIENDINRMFRILEEDEHGNVDKA